jgi:hypothetical protein
MNCVEYNQQNLTTLKSLEEKYSDKIRADFCEQISKKNENSFLCH